MLLLAFIFVGPKIFDSESDKPATTLPVDESDLISTVNAFEERYSGAANEFQKSAIRRERANTIAEILPSRSVSGWIGQVASMHTTSDGRGVLSVKFPGSYHIEVETMNNIISDISSDTLILQESPLYHQVANLAEDDKVIFSGRFASSDMDYIEEFSVTEEGSMTEPDFVFTFASVSKETPLGVIGNSPPPRTRFPQVVLPQPLPFLRGVRCPQDRLRARPIIPSWSSLAPSCLKFIIRQMLTVIPWAKATIRLNAQMTNSPKF